MAIVDLESTAAALVAAGKGILAADETAKTLTERFDSLNVHSTPDTRRSYREMLFTTTGIAQCISGVVMQDETIHQQSSIGRPVGDVLAQQGIIPGIKGDTGAKRLAGTTAENITEGLDGLRDRLMDYAQTGARFAKWRAVIRIGDALPTSGCVLESAHALARDAALCQEQGPVPIVEPEVLMDGSETIERCEEVTGNVPQPTFDVLFVQRVSLEGMLLKPNMVIAAKERPQQASVEEVSRATLRCLRGRAPAAVPGIVFFLSGGQNHLVATIHLNAINQLDGPKPWRLRFSFGRALQDEALQAWHGNPENLEAGQQAFAHRAECVSAAALSKDSRAMESELTA